MAYKGKYISVIIPAAGMGKRMDKGMNKQFILLKGKPILAHTIDKFNSCPYIDEIIIVTREEEKKYCRDNIIDKYGFHKVNKIVKGGEERQDSVYNGLIAVDNKCDIVLIHDGARPFVNGANIADAIKGVIKYKACVIGVPTKDTIKVVDGYSNVKDTPNRKYLWSVQTPQAFDYNLILKAYKDGMANSVSVTDDSMLVERLGYEVKMINGSYNNIKITTPEDLQFGELIAKGGE
ncbi:2-C-methyl-D-erythritol 4-phosphate cytidylyltransferase [Dethiothermospora halolimnae]|uniref:2-C-methyl-D-erythritol 4-phosphate cytidylyltransferase n=1 Tax=Dethiothermospora halolimnae TaxID=3114390 RepID=UPI003CCC04CB